MDLPRPEILRQLRLTLSSEGRRFVYFLSDLSTGKIFSVPRDTAAGLQRLSVWIDGQGDGREAQKPEKSELELSLRAFAYVKSMRNAERSRAAKFNPVSMQIPLFDIGRFQPYFAPFARWFVGLPAVILIATLAVLVLTLGIRNDWAIASEFNGLLQIETLIAFGLLSPFLKIVHEIGHVLVATAAGVRVRNAAVSLIGLYPLPSVDCTEAEVTANKRDRILISLAGVFTDFIIGAVAFLVWHVVDSDTAKSLAGRVLVFSTINSLAFNANPLMKLDVYYAVVDAMGQRNLYSRATQKFAGLRRWIFSLGATGEVPRGTEAWALTSYGLLTLIYRLYVLTKILTAVLPQYLGVGLIAGIWGGYVMLVSPLLADPAPKAPNQAPRWRRIGGGFGFVFLLVLALLFLKLPFVQRINLTLDDGRYQLAADGTGVVTDGVGTTSMMAAGDPVLTQTNVDLGRKLSLLEGEKIEADLLVANTRSVGAAAAKLADDRLAVVTEQIGIVREELDRLVTHAPADGLFVSKSPLRPGTYLDGGIAIGRFYPSAGEAALTGHLSENWVEIYQDDPPVAELYLQGIYVPLGANRLELRQGATNDPVTRMRSITLSVVVPKTPAELVGADLQLRLNFGREPLWKHLQFWANRKLTAFRDAQVADRQSRLGGVDQ